MDGQQQIIITDNAYDALIQAQDAEAARLGYKRPYKMIASDAIKAYAQTLAGNADRESKAAEQDDVAKEAARRLLSAHGGNKEKALAAMYPDWPQEFKDKVEKAIREGK